MVRSLEGLRVIVRSVVKSLPDVTNILLLMCIMMFILAVVGVSIFGDAMPEYFNSLPSGMRALSLLELTHYSDVHIVHMHHARWMGRYIQRSSGTIFTFNH